MSSSPFPFPSALQRTGTGIRNSLRKPARRAIEQRAHAHYVFVVIHLETRRIVHVSSTLAPTVAWTVQQLRELTPFGNGPKFLLRDNDGKFTATFDDVASGAGIRVIRTPVLAPTANAFVERFVGSLRRECLDHVLLLAVSRLL